MARLRRFGKGWEPISKSQKWFYIVETKRNKRTTKRWKRRTGKGKKKSPHRTIPGRLASSVLTKGLLSQPIRQQSSRSRSAPKRRYECMYGARSALFCRHPASAMQQLLNQLLALRMTSHKHFLTEAVLCVAPLKRSRSKARRLRRHC